MPKRKKECVCVLGGGGEYHPRENYTNISKFNVFTFSFGVLFCRQRQFLIFVWRGWELSEMVCDHCSYNYKYWFLAHITTTAFLPLYNTLS